MQNHGGQILCMPSGRQQAGAGIFHLILPGCFWGTFGSLCQIPCSAQHCAEIKTQPAWYIVLVAHTGAAWLWLCRQSRQQRSTEPLAALQDGWHRAPASLLPYDMLVHPVAAISGMPPNSVDLQVCCWKYGHVWAQLLSRGPFPTTWPALRLQIHRVDFARCLTFCVFLPIHCHEAALS